MPKHFDRLSNGELPSQTWPGMYPVLYLTYEKRIICASCANGGCGSQYTTDTQDKRWLIVDQFVLVDGEPLECSYCDKKVSINTNRE